MVCTCKQHASEQHATQEVHVTKLILMIRVLDEGYFWVTAALVWCTTSLYPHFDVQVTCTEKQHLRVFLGRNIHVTCTNHVVLRGNRVVKLGNIVATIIKLVK